MAHEGKLYNSLSSSPSNNLFLCNVSVIIYHFFNKMLVDNFTLLNAARWRQFCRGKII